jgi:small subunit ribosomal protein S1
VRLEDRDGNILPPMYQARLRKDWARAREMLDSSEVWRGKVVEFNKGGLVVNFGHLRGKANWLPERYVVSMVII